MTAGFPFGPVTFKTYLIMINMDHNFPLSHAYFRMSLASSTQALSSVGIPVCHENPSERRRDLCSHFTSYLCLQWALRYRPTYSFQTLLLHNRKESHASTSQISPLAEASGPMHHLPRLVRPSNAAPQFE